MPKEESTIFAEGMRFELPLPQAPEWVKGRISIKVDDFIKFLQEFKNSDGFVNIGLKVSKAGNGYAVLDTWKPTPKAASTPRPAEISVPTGEGVEYPEEQINPDEIPF